MDAPPAVLPPWLPPATPTEPEALNAAAFPLRMYNSLTRTKVRRKPPLL